MSTPALFIGVVSYVGSRFSISQGEGGLAALLADTLEQRGIPTAVSVSTDDRHDPAVLWVDESVIQGSLSAQQQLEDAWLDYVRAGKAPSARARANSGLRWGRRQWRRLRGPGPGPVTRLINIELAHAALLSAGLASRAPWILIVEDDAATCDVADCAEGVLGLMASVPDSVAFVNVSESFPLAELGIDHLLTPSAQPWAGQVPRSVLTAERPVTNTVCAILYRATFAAELLAEFDRMPMTPVVPIDWKLNAALMHMHADGRLGPDSCLLVSPGPIDQLSMRPTAETP